MKILIFALMLVSTVHAAELAGVTLEDKLSVEGHDLVLNGIGIRKITKFGFPIKVYVGGLYTPKKSKDQDEILKMKGAKKIIMQFMLAVERDSLIDVFSASFKGNCLVECEKKSEMFALLKVHIPSVRKGDQMNFIALPDKMIIEVKGANARRVEIPGAAISTNIVAMFINKVQPPSPELRASLLGL